MKGLLAAFCKRVRSTFRSIFLMGVRLSLMGVRSILSLVLLMGVCLISACGGVGQTEPDEVVPHAPAEQPAPVTPPAKTPTKGQSEITYIDEGFAETLLDSDGDGLTDQLDAQPQTPLVVQSGQGSIAITRFGLAVEDLIEDRMVVSGERLAGKLENSEYYTPPFYLLWHSQYGTFAEEITVDTDGRFTTSANESMATSVSVAAAGFESAPYVLTSVKASAPVLFSQDKPAFTGENLVFNGLNLDKIEQVWLGEDSIEHMLVDGMLHLRLPEMATSKLLRFKTSDDIYSKSINLMRSIILAADSDLPNPTEWYAMSGDQKVFLTPHDSGVYKHVTLALPVSNSLSFVRFYHQDFRDVEAAIWPNSREVSLGLRSTFEKQLVNKLSSSLSNDTYSQIQLTFTQIMDSAIGQEILAPISALLQQPMIFENEHLLEQQVNQAYAQLATHVSIPALMNPFISASTQSVGGSSVFDYLDDTFAAIFATNVMFEPISSIVGLRAKPGSNTYADLSIGMYTDLSTCAGLRPTLPNGIWPSDLCVSNSAVYFASAKVTRRVDGKVVKNHIKELIDPNMIGASGWGILSLDDIGYLTSDKGEPLCHMQSCSIEFITGGFGVTTNVSLTKQQNKVYTKVLGRTLLERVIIPTISWALGIISVDGVTGKCLADFVISNSASSVKDYGIMVVEFKKKLDAANNENEVITIMKDTVFKYAYDVASSMLSSQKLPACLSPGLKTEYLASLKDKAGEFAEKIAVPFRVANTATQAFQGFNAVTAPEVFTFDVAPRAAITSIYTSNSNDDVPELFSTVDDNKLFIRGTKFAYLRSDSNTDFYWPKLRLRDRYGNKQTLQINESHKIDVSDLSWVDIGIPVSDLKPLMEKLRGDIINVSLIMDDQAYPRFSSEGLPLPGRDIRWVGQPKLFKTSPQNIRAGRLLTLRGENLQSFSNRSDLKLKYIQANDATKTGETLRYESANDSQIKFRTSSDLPIGLYKLNLETSDPNLTLKMPDDVSKGNLVGAINVIPSNASLVALYDAGAKIDDGMRVVINNDAGELISQNNELLSLSLTENNPLPAVTMWWDRSGLSAPDDDTQPRQVTVVCDSGGLDQICTYRIKGEVLTGGQFKSLNFRGKLREGEDVTHRFSTP